jgi:hypothetical protein
VRAAARRPVEIADLNDSHRAFDLRLAAQRQTRELLRIGEKRAYRHVAFDDRIGEIFGSSDTSLIDVGNVDIDRARRLAEPCRHGLRLGNVEQSARQDVLPGVERHVDATAREVDLAGDLGPDGRRLAVNDVMQCAVISNLHVAHFEPGELSPIGHLTSPFGEERGAIEDKARLAVELRPSSHRRPKFDEKWVVVIKAFGFGCD